jgi:hypothetical protein
MTHRQVLDLLSREITFDSLVFSETMVDLVDLSHDFMGMWEL